MTDPQTRLATALAERYRAATAPQGMKRWWGPEFVEHMVEGWRKAGLDVPAEHQRDEAAATT